mmetsp:Transcript_27796/g.44573  ORF Transcript_27796/g.44573 Transcript_27796/m.44573 type:complete len:378 (-) Transcript_27796:1780-2913(-)
MEHVRCRHRASSRRVAALAGHLHAAEPAVGVGVSSTATATSTLWRHPTSSSAQRTAPALSLAEVAAGSGGGVVVAAEVAAALASGRAVVALESTIVSHGMPYPQNLAMAREVEAVVRLHGAVPATIAIMDGVPHVGLSDEHLERLAKMGAAAAKVSRRDIASIVARGVTGATTVSATMLLAARAGIAVFVTGGIGGVHRGGERTMDVSADLTELGRTPVAVVCAGAKSVLDIPRTLEFLETQGAAVVGYGVDEFPAFFTRASGCAAPARVDTPRQAAALIKAGRRLGLGGVVFGVPIPAADEALGAGVEAAIGQALSQAEEEHVIGNAVTPFLLKRIRELTGGASLAANIALVKNNAAVGAQIAAALANLDATHASR